MRILFLCHGFNSLTQRLFVELCAAGHDASVEFDVNDTVTEEAVELFRPDLILAPFLKRAIPASVWRRHLCLVVHPGIPGDRGPSALDWAITNGEREWGVTVLQAAAEMDRGDIWASAGFPMRDGTKGSIYRNEVTEAAVRAVLQAVARAGQGGFVPRPLDYRDPAVRGRWRRGMRQADRAIDWAADDTATVLRRIRGADGQPGVKDLLAGRQLFLFDAHPEPELAGPAGALVARCGPAVCRATADGAVWIGHASDPRGVHPFKLPAVRVLGGAAYELPEINPTENSGYREIWYREAGGVGFLHFRFYNGAMGSDQCDRLRRAFIDARRRETRVIVLMGGPDHWSNGMHLNLIEAAESPADESWRNINAIDDLAREIIVTDTHLTVSALAGNAGAGGVLLARSADRVWARSGVVLNPHYKDMGNLYGSEYWTYLLPRYAGEENTRRITRGRLPMGTVEAGTLGLVDERIDLPPERFGEEVARRAEALASSSDLVRLLEEKRARRRDDEAEKPLEDYRAAELERMHMNFYGFDPSYHVARYNFVHKVPKSRTPLTLAKHRRIGAGSG